MVAGLKKIDWPLGDTVDEAVFLRDAPQPASCQHEHQWLRLADAVGYRDCAD
jgi:hypothetical protein